MRSNKNKTLILSSLDVQEVIKHFGVDWLMDRLIERLTEAVKTFDAEKISIPKRDGFNYTKPQTGLVEWMPLYTQGKQVLIKVVGYHPKNPKELELPTILSTISVYDTESGHLSAVMDGVLPTAIRTGAASAVASRLLANPKSSVLGLIGCGAQAVTQLHGLSRIFDFDKVLIYDIDQNAIDSLETRCSSLNLDVDFVFSSIEETVSESDILCTATSIEIGEGPLFKELPTKNHLHINAVGSDFPGKIEIPIDFLEQSFICPDFTQQAIIEGECQQVEKSKIGADLVEVAKNESEYKQFQNQRTVFDSTGWALEDKIVMDLFLDCAIELSLGKEVEIENMPEDSKNPYDFLSLKKTEIHVVNTIIETIAS